MSSGNGQFSEQMEQANKEVLSRLLSALGAKSKAEALDLIAADPEARKIAKRILGVSSPLGLKGVLNLPTRPDKDQKPKIEF